MDSPGSGVGSTFQMTLGAGALPQCNCQSSTGLHSFGCSLYAGCVPMRAWQTVTLQPAALHYHLTPYPLSDADIERIAQRVAQLIKER